ncbi:MAG: tRNA lysidine(34) synthetase TilS [Aerococcus sp.]|nr:tRNA lysidine(34) synthetase TilS [Aerococcus sp.]
MDFDQLVSEVDQWLSDWHIDRQHPILIAVSGGVDSMVLLTVAKRLMDEGKLFIKAMHINHQLRSDAIADQQLVIDYCEQHQIDLAVRIWQHDALSGNVEAAARQFRYANFSQYLKQQDMQAVMTAHHQNDVAETTLMRLIHGSSISAVGGMAPVAPLALDKTQQVLRPLLGVDKDDLYQCAKEANIPYREDETNTSLAYTRNRMRHQWLVALKEENPNVVSHLAQFSTELNAMLTFAQSTITESVSHLLEEQADSWRIDLEQWRTYSPDQRPLLLKAMLFKVSRETFERFGGRGLNELSDFLAGGRAQGEWDLPEGYRIVKVYDTGIIQLPLKKQALDNTPHYRISPESQVPLSNHHLLTRRLADQPQGYWLPQALVTASLELRGRQAGDYIVLADKHQQKLRRYFINEKIPKAMRERALILASEHWVVAIIDPKLGTVIYRYPVRNYMGGYWQLLSRSDE